jgi:hypothetical protein
LLLILAPLLLASENPSAAPPLEYLAAGAAAAEITEGNLLASERFWPYQAELTREWTAPDGARRLAPRARGVLIRVEADGFARIDFARSGVQRVPVAATDLVARANRVRRGEIEKLGPNFTAAIGQRLVSASGEKPRPMSLSEVLDRSGFLCVFADPFAEQVPALARALAPLRGRNGVEILFFPRGRSNDERVLARLREIDWRVPFVFAHLSEPYTQTLVDAGSAFPLIQLLSAEGRLLFQHSGAGLDLQSLGVAIDSLSAAR